MHRAYIALGSNIGDAERNVEDAKEALSLLLGTRVVKASKNHVTKPWGYSNQPDFINAAVLVETELSPRALLGACLGIEAAMGRRRTIKNGPRVIDLDLLTYDDLEINSAELMLPHPGMAERDFVQGPLGDIKDAETDPQ